MKSKWLFTSLFFMAFCMSAYGIQVSAPDLEVQPGDAITIEVSVDDATGIAGADFSLVYDPAILAATDARLTELGTGLIPSDPNLTVAGQVTMAIMGLQGIAEGSGALIEVDFDVLLDAAGVSPLDLSAIALYNELGEDLPVEVVNGSVTVAGVEPSPEEVNKAFISEYLQALSGKEKPAEVVDQYISDEDQVLKQHIVMFEAGFPLYELIPEDMIAEGDKVAVRSTFHGVHKGEFAGVPPTDVEATMTLNITYRIAEGKIVEHWMEADQLGLMRQLGVVADGLESYDWGAPSDVVGDPGDPEANKDLVLSIIDVWNQQDIDMVDELVNPDFVNHNPASGPPQVGIDAYKQSIVEYTTAFPDLFITVDDMVAEGDRVAKRWTATGTHQGELSGIPPLGTAVTFTGITIYRFADGKLVENWWAWDTLGLMQQIAPEIKPEDLLAILDIGDQAVNTHDADLFNTLVTDDFVYDYVPQPPPFEGKEAMAGFLNSIFQAFPDFKVEFIRPPMISGNIAVVEHIASGTHQGEWAGTPPTGKSIRTVHTDIVEFEGDKIKKILTYDDVASQLVQLGLMPVLPLPELKPSFTLPAPEPTGLSPLEAALEIDRRFNSHDLANYSKIFRSDAEVLVSVLGTPVDRDAFVALVELYFLAFPDIHEEIVRMVEMPDGWVLNEFVFTGTNTGSFFGIPATGRFATLRGAVLERFDSDGLLTDAAIYYDNVTIMAQLDLLQPPSPDTEANKTLFLRYGDEVLSQGKLEVVDEIIAEDFIHRSAGVVDAEGVEGTKAFVAMFRTAFPDLVAASEDVVAEDDKVVVRTTYTGTHQGDLMGVPPTGVAVTFTGICVARAADGKIAEVWTQYDALGLMQQLGVVTPGRPAPENYMWGAPSEVTGAPGDPEENKAAVQRMIDEVFGGNLAVVDELFAADYLMHDPASTMEVRGPEGFKQWAGTMLEPYFSDGHIVVEDMIAEVDKVAVRWSWAGTHAGEFLGIPATGKRITVTGTSIHRFADGKFVESWVSYDTLGMMQQITPTEPGPTLPEIILASLAISDSAVNSQDPDLLVSIFVDDLVYDYVPVSPPIEGKEAMREYFAGVFQTFPDLTVTLIRPPLVAGDIAVVEHIMTGTHLGELDLGPAGKIPPTGNSFQTMHMDIAEFEEGKVKKGTTYDDMASQLIQLGLMPASEIDPALLVPSFPLPEAEPTGLSPLEANAEAFSRYNTHDLENYARMIHPDAEFLVGPLGVTVGREAYLAVNENGYFQMSSDLHAEVLRAIDMGDGWVLSEVMVTGINDRPSALLGLPATGNSFAVRAATLHRFDENGLMTNLDFYADNLTLVTQLGLFPPEEPPTKDYSNKFYMSLTSGLNMISLPLEPEEPYTARSFAEEIGATLVIRYDEVLKKFEGFALNAPGDGFILEGGRGYIVNVLESKVVEFTGAAWENEPPVQAAPPDAQAFSAWAFLVNGTVLDGEDMSLSDGDYTVVVKNLRTGAVAGETVGEEGYFAAVWADLSRKAVVEAGDKLEVAVVDSSGKVASGPFVHDITLDGIRNALVKIQLRLGDIIPEKSALLQNYPNPFNPETWIPFHLKGEASVSIRIFSLSGQLIRTLQLGHMDAGVYVSRTKAAYWDGKNEAGEEVSSGIYFYSIAAGDFSATKKMIIRK